MADYTSSKERLSRGFLYRKPLFDYMRTDYATVATKLTQNHTSIQMALKVHILDSQCMRCVEFRLAFDVVCRRFSYELILVLKLIAT